MLNPTKRNLKFKPKKNAPFHLATRKHKEKKQQ
jgi:hypothetical protein